MATITGDATTREVHERAGAVWGETAPGVEGVLDYGDPAEERRALVEACGVVDRSWTGRLEMTGDDRVRFLQGLVTCDVKATAPGGGIFGFVTSRKGQVLADLRLLALDDRLWLELPAGRVEAIAEHLSAFKIVDRVEIGPLDRVPLTVGGPRAAAVIAAAAGEEPPAAEWQHRAASIGGRDVRICRRGLVGVEAFDVWVRPDGARDVWAALVEAGARPGGFTALETVRVEHGIPRWGAEIGPDTLPQETGLGERAVSYTKGCYLGQEIVARIHYRGGVNRGLVALRFPEGADLPAAGAAVLADGRKAGTVGSALRSPELGPIGLAILQLRAAEPGARVEVEGGGVVEVAEVPR